MIGNSETLRSARRLAARSRSKPSRLRVACAVGLALFVAIGFASTPRRAAADAPEEDLDATPKARAERLFLRGKELLAEGKTEAACVTFEESLRVDRAGGTMLNLAECYVAAHRYASAARALRDAKSLAAAAHRDDAQAFAEKRLGEILPLVSQVTVAAPEVIPEGFAIQLDGAPAAPGAAIEVDAGAHALRASAPSCEPFSVTFDITNDGSRLTLRVPALELIAKPGPTKTGPSARLLIGAIAAGTGGALVLVGATLGVDAVVQWNGAKDACPGASCSDLNAVVRSHESGVLADASTVALTVGLATTALGLTLAITAPAKVSSDASARLRIGASGFRIEGSF